MRDAHAGTTLTAVPFELSPLLYTYDALWPTIDELTMRTHHGHHHAAHIRALNEALAGTGWEEQPLETILAHVDRLPASRRAAVRHHGGGHANHVLYWQTLTPNGGGAPRGELAAAIRAAFGSFDRLRAELTTTAATLFGSGWAWLVYDGGALAVISTPNQESPLLTGAAPLLGIDLWEHAYYLKFRHRRADHVEAFWNVIDWGVVASRHAAAVAAHSRT
jgi:superoxide dismutase, Fe-Mn family